MGLEEEKKDAWLGIDPGKTGAVAYLTKDGLTGVFDYVDAVSNARELGLLKATFNIQLAVLEKVSAMPKQGVSSSFNFGVNYGEWIGILAALGIPFYNPSVKAWQKEIVRKTDGNDPKERSLVVARRLFPNEELGRKKDADRADALLMAYWGRMQTFKEIQQVRDERNDRSKQKSTASKTKKVRKKRGGKTRS